MKNSRTRALLLASLVGLAGFLFPLEAKATNLIKRPGAHPNYGFEATPHLIVAPFDNDIDFGAGFRGTFNIVDTGFIRKLNDSVGITLGGDYTDDRNLYLSAAMQWNFWFTEQWSAFGEPGVGYVVRHRGSNHLDGSFAAGGRLMLSSSLSLTLRLGYPASAIGVSFFF